MKVERFVTWWACPLMSVGVVLLLGLGYLLFLTPFAWCGLFFCYAAVACALVLFGVSAVLTLWIATLLVLRRRYARAASCVGSWLAVYVVAFFATRYALILWVYARTGW